MRGRGFALALASHTTQRPRLDLQSIKGDRLAAIDAAAEVGVMHARQRLADGAQVDHFAIGLSQVDVAIRIALGRVIAVLLQQLMGPLDTAGAALVPCDLTVEFVLAQLQQLLQQRTLTGAQERLHIDSRKKLRRHRCAVCRRPL